MRKLSVIFAFLVSVPFLGVSHAGTYKIDESHTQVGFKIKHLVISTVSGRFNKFAGEFKYDASTGKLEGLKTTIEANSIDTNEPDRDKHLRSKDFFDVDKFKTLEFVAKDVSYKEKKPAEIKGDLTIHGITKSVTLKVDFKGEAVDPWGNQRAAFEASTRVNRKDFGLKWNKNLDKGGVMIADDVDILIEGEAILQKEANKK
ncbi:MAG: YceI family protein [Bdellovibrionales bacterium]